MFKHPITTIVAIAALIVSSASAIFFSKKIDALQKEIYANQKILSELSSKQKKDAELISDRAGSLAAPTTAGETLVVQALDPKGRNEGQITAQVKLNAQKLGEYQDALQSQEKELSEVTTTIACENRPMHPKFLSKDYIVQSELPATSLSISEFIEQAEQFSTCAAALISPSVSDTSEDRETENATMNQRAFRTIELIEKNTQLAIDRNNYLLDNVEYGELKKGE